MIEPSQPCLSCTEVSQILHHWVSSHLLLVCFPAGCNTCLGGQQLLGIFLISIYGVNARGIFTPNILVGVIVFFGGVCQFISGIMEFVAGNTFGATVFPSYAAFNLSYAMIYIPGSGILASYTDSSTGQLNSQFSQALAMYLWAWFILTAIYTIAAMRSSWVLFLDLFFLDIDLLLLACGYMLNNTALLKAGNSIGFVVAFLSCRCLKSSPVQMLANSTVNRLGRMCWFMGRGYHANQPAHLPNV
jgi:succinate-acetate transporter protein